MTPKTGKSQPSHANRLGRVLLQAMEEILAAEGVKEVLDASGLSEFGVHPAPGDQELESLFQKIGHLQAGLESLYGLRAGQGLAVRIGRAVFKYGFGEFGPEHGLGEASFRFLSLQAKLARGSEILADWFNAQPDFQIEVQRDAQTISLCFKSCPLCDDRQADTPDCYLMVGLLQEALFWVSGGKYFEVEEKQCLSCGDKKCSFEINRHPFG